MAWVAKAFMIMSIPLAILWLGGLGFAKGVFLLMAVLWSVMFAYVAVEDLIKGRKDEYGVSIGDIFGNLFGLIIISAPPLAFAIWLIWG